MGSTGRSGERAKSEQDETTDQGSMSSFQARVGKRQGSRAESFGTDTSARRASFWGG